MSMDLVINGFAKFYKIHIKSATLLGAKGPGYIKAGFNPQNGNVQVTVTNLDLDVELDAEIKGGWVMPVTVQRLKIYGANLFLEFSGRKNDPNAYKPVDSKLTIKDFEIFIKESVF